MSESLADLLGGRPHHGATNPLLFDRGRPLTAADFVAETARIAGGLGALGIARGDRVAIWLPNVPAWLATFAALARLGAIAVAVNTRFRSQELATILRRAEPRALVYWPGFNGIDFAGILADCDPAALTSITWLIEYNEADSPPTARHDVSVERAVERIDFAALPAAAVEAQPQESDANDSLPCILFSTSGTTKEPKLVLHDQRTLARHAHNVAAAWHLGPGSAVYLVPPLCGVYGFCTALAALAGGAPLWMRPAWDAGAAAAEIVRGACTHITGTDDIYAQLLATTPAQRPFPSLTYAGFAPFNPALADIVAHAQARGLMLSGLYGTSEVQALFSVRMSDRAAAERSRAGGHPVSATAHVRARDPETGALLPHGTNGALEILAPESRMVCYFGNEDATAASFTADGWYRTGDIGSTSADGNFVFLTRAGDSLRIGGFLVSPAEIENVVQEAGGIDACQVVAVPRPEGWRPVAFVIPEAGSEVDESRLSSHVRARLAPYKVPVRFLAIDAFPVTASANGTKIRKDVLRQIALDALNGTGSLTSSQEVA